MTGTDAGRRACRHARAHRSRLALVLWLALVTLGVCWWEFAAPVELGGGTSFVIIEGRSMEPLLYDGDLAVARAQADYRIGDLVVFGVGKGRVIHRIVGGSPTAWVTKGDNNGWLDPWPVADDDVVGAYVMRVGGAGSSLVWLLRHPVAFALAAALATIVTYLPRRPRHVHPTLAAALAHAHREDAREGRPVQEYALLVMLLVATTGTYLVSLLALLQRQFTPVTVTATSALVVSLVLTWGMLHRLFDGSGQPEPVRSLHALSGRLYRVDTPPVPPPPVTPVAGAVALRRLAECRRLPVLHHVAIDTTQHTFLVITPDEGTFLWAPHAGDNPSLGQEAESRVVRSVTHLPSLPGHARGGPPEVARVCLAADARHLAKVNPVGAHAPGAHRHGGRADSCEE